MSLRDSWCIPQASWQSVQRCPLGCPASRINQGWAHHRPGLLPAHCQGPLAARNTPGARPTNLSVKVASQTLWKGRRTAARVGRWGSCRQLSSRKVCSGPSCCLPAADLCPLLTLAPLGPWQVPITDPTHLLPGAPPQLGVAARNTLGHPPPHPDPTGLGAAWPWD